MGVTKIRDDGPDHRVASAPSASPVEVLVLPLLPAGPACSPGDSPRDPALSVLAYRGCGVQKPSDGEADKSGAYHHVYPFRSLSRTLPPPYRQTVSTMRTTRRLRYRQVYGTSSDSFFRKWVIVPIFLKDVLLGGGERRPWNLAFAGTDRHVKRSLYAAHLSLGVRAAFSHNGEGNDRAIFGRRLPGGADGEKPSKAGTGRAPMRFAKCASPRGARELTACSIFPLPAREAESRAA